MGYLTDTRREEALELLCGAIRTVTVNPDGGEEALAARLAAVLRDAGLEARMMEFAPGRANVFARLKGREDGSALMLNGHLDTVPFGDADSWNTPPAEPVVKDGMLYGRGSSDMKGGLCAALYALCSLAKEGFVPRHDLLFLGTGDEESSGLGAQAAVEAGLLDKVGGIVIGEPTGNKLSVASKGTFWLELSVRGRTSHGAYPWEGINAVEIACALAAAIKPLVSGAPNPYLSPPTCTLTGMQGGVKVNVVPDRCRMTFDIRTVPGTSHADLLAQVEGLIEAQKAATPGVEIACQVLTDRMAVETDPQDTLVAALSESVAAVCGSAPGLTGTGFFSDASVFLRSYSVPTVLFGPGESSEAHKPNESLSLARYYEAVECYREFLSRL